MNYTGGGKTPQDAAKEWAAEFVKGLSPATPWPCFQARQQVVPVVARAEPRPQAATCRSAILRHAPARRRLRPARAPFRRPSALLAKSDAVRARRDRADRRPDASAGPTPDTMQHWEQLGRQLGADKPQGAAGPPPRLWVVNVDPHRDPDPPNWSLAPLRVNRPVVPGRP